MSDESLWIFGYGSLVWRPAFAHLRRRPACIEGYIRRFWQGSTDHRGVPGRPGRVVTLLPEPHRGASAQAGLQPARCWGTAYELPVDDSDRVLPGLDHRERGGYERLELELFLAGGDTVDEPATDRGMDSLDLDRAPGLAYIAGPENDNYLGPAPVEQIAAQIVTAEGPSGANPEYVFELARSLRAMGVADTHVFEVEHAVRVELSRVEREQGA